MRPRRDLWLERAGEPGLTLAQREYAAARADALTRGLRGRVEGCGKKGSIVSCACGRKLTPWRCSRTLLCWGCAAYRRWRVVDRIQHAIQRQQAMLPGARTLLVTLSCAHDVPRLGGVELTAFEKLVDQRHRLAEGWRAFTRAAGRRWGYVPYVGVWEVTPGRDGLGHLHLHVVVQWGFRDWSEVAALWRECCPSSTRINLQESWDARQDSAERAAKYLSKYLGKTRGRPSEDRTSADWTPEMHARVNAATYQLRWLFAARGHLPPLESVCPTCGQSPCPSPRQWLSCEAERGLWKPEWYDWEVEPGWYQVDLEW